MSKSKDDEKDIRRAFRAIRKNKALQIETQEGGRWIGSLAGLSETDVRKQFDRLRHSRIENTEDFTYGPNAQAAMPAVPEKMPSAGQVSLF